MLTKNHFIGGQNLTQDDVEVMNQIKPSADDLSPATHPNLFAWFSLVMKFTEQAAATWPKGNGKYAVAK